MTGDEDWPNKKGCNSKRGIGDSGNLCHWPSSPSPLSNLVSLAYLLALLAILPSGPVNVGDGLLA